MKQVILHIGFHKTGTSSLQEALNCGREKLLESGIYYPKSILGFPAQQEIAWSLIQKPKPWMKISIPASEIYERIIKDFEEHGAKKLLLSSEDLTFLEHSPNQLHILKSFLKSYQTEIIAYVREPVSFLLSYYGHRLRVGATEKEFLPYVIENMNPRIACFSDRLAIWESIFGEKNIIVRKYASKSFFGDSISSDFLSAIGADIFLSTPKRSNESVHPWLAQAYLGTLRADSLPNKESTLKQLRNIGAALPKTDARNVYLTKQQGQLLDSFFKTSNKSLKVKYGIEFN